MLATERSKQTPTCNANVLPCKIGYNGQINASKRLWNPEIEANGQKTAYFRGRKLVGRNVVVPKGYKGVILEKTGRSLSCQPQVPLQPEQEGQDDEDEDESEQPEVHVMQEVSTFDNITIWGHEALPLDADDPYLKGVQEWMTFAQNIHSYDPQDKAK